MTDRHKRSHELYERACRVMAGGVSSEFRRGEQPHPLFYRRGRGARIEDVDGNEYLDFTLSQGPLILGHCHPVVVEATRRQAGEGQLFAGQHCAELELAELLQHHIPSAERLRFGLTGSEAVQGALRIARAATGRRRFVRFEGHYHGWLDSAVPGIVLDDDPWTEGVSSGAAADAIVLPWNDLAALTAAVSREADSIAAVITEPIMCNTGCIPPEPGFLEGMRRLCTDHGIRLVFDEVITGFRLGLGGAQAEAGVTPDLSVFGKAMASGHPISVVAGRAETMEVVASGRAVLAGTMNGCNSSVAAALATLGVLSAPGAHEPLYRLGQRLMTGLRSAGAHLAPPLHVQGPGPMFHAGFTSRERLVNARDVQTCDGARYARFVRELQARGVRVIGRGLWYLSLAHTDADIDRCLAAAGDALRAL